MTRAGSTYFADGALGKLYHKINEREHHNTPISFKTFMELAAWTPQIVFRNIFQIFYDMVKSNIGEGVDEYPDDPESIHYVYYDCNKIFVDGTDHPFFADRLFANRLVNHFAAFKRGLQQNRIYIFEGPHGSGKSTFLNNLLLKFEQFTKTDKGASYETVWRLDKKKLGSTIDSDAHALLSQLRGLVDSSAYSTGEGPKEQLENLTNKERLDVPCPSHDHPFLLIPKDYRKDVLDDLIKDGDFKKKLFKEKQYDWIFKDKPCTICMSIYETLQDFIDDPNKVFEMVFARRYQFNRRLGEGISVFNPGDGLTKQKVITNEQLQSQVNRLLQDSNRVRYIYSRYAKTNNGVYALMDVKSHNEERFSNLHGIISEGVHKVEDIEENVNSLFLALMNPEDKENIIGGPGTQSFTDRITYIRIPYVLDYNTEVKIYKSIFGDQIEKHFLPRILENFAKVIISTRLNPTSEGMLRWIGSPEKYSLYCDKNLHLLKMDIFTGLIPSWLSEDDRKNFTAQRRKKIIGESEWEGDKGFSGRDSIKIFENFFSTYAKGDKLINMSTVCNYFQKRAKDLPAEVSEDFLSSLVRFYDYTVLQEVKESLYYYNEERISRDIQNYLFAINFEIGSSEKSVYTGEEIEINEDFFKDIEERILGSNVTVANRWTFRKDIQNQYTSKTLTQEIMVEGKNILETDAYNTLHERYIHNLKEKVMDPFLKNDNFRNAIKDFATESFKTYDRRIREEVSYLIKNLKENYDYTEKGAKEVCIYVVDNNIAKTFSEKNPIPSIF